MEKEDVMNNEKAPNPFTYAKRVPGLTVTIKPSDITDFCPGLSIVEVEALLSQHAPLIAVQMIAAGINAAVQIIQEGANQS